LNNSSGGTRNIVATEFIPLKIKRKWQKKEETVYLQD
jgi:hypothetical protein